LARRKAPERPTREQILAFIEESPRRVGKREIARAFSLGHADRTWLRETLKTLKAEGLLAQGRGRQAVPPGELPPVGVIEISHIDEDGELVARPTAWHDAETPPPTIYLAPSRHRRVAPKPGDRVLAHLKKVDEAVYEARAIRILGPAAKSLIGVLEIDRTGAGLLHPADRKHRRPYAIAEKDRGGAASGDFVTAEVLPGGMRTHRARNLERIGPADDPRSFSLVAIHTLGLPLEFPREALDAADRLAPATLETRTDLRQLPLVTIDGADARDFDDAVFAERDTGADNPEGWRLIVAIADVGHYVTTGDALDKAARERGNSAYFPDRVVPMLPERLSNDLCSLRPGEDRACLAAEMRIDRDGNAIDHQFSRGLIRSAARLTYDQVQAARDGAPDDKTEGLVETVISPLYGAFEALSRAREARGTLELEFVERQVLLKEDGWVDNIVPRPRHDSHRLIEEFMIAANVAAAETLHARRAPAMYRVHEPPSAADLETLRESLKGLGFNLVKDGAIRPRQFAGILAQAKAAENLPLVSDLILRAQSKAVYAPRDLGHFGLALRRYCHFTSPIRRYADLLVHRALITALALGSDGLPPEVASKFEETGEHISATERRATAAERDSVDRFTSAFLSDRVGATFSGRINGVTRFGLFVTLDETGADGFLPRRHLPWDRYRHDTRRHRLLGEESGLSFTMGQPISVELLEAEPRTGSLVLKLLEGGERDAPGPAGGRARKRGRKRRAR